MAFTILFLEGNLEKTRTRDLPGTLAIKE